MKRQELTADKLLALAAGLIEFNELLKEATKAIDQLIPKFDAAIEQLREEEDNGD